MKIEKDKETIAICKGCKAEFVEWISDSKHCPECENEVVFQDKQRE